MFDQDPNDFANVELLMRQAAMTAIEQFLIILILIIAALSALALLAALGGLLWQRARESAAAIEAAAPRSRTSARSVIEFHRRSPNALSPQSLP